MEVKALALRALKEIIDEKTPFQIVLERVLSEYNLSNEDKRILRLNVLGSIKHFYFLRYELLTVFPQFEPDDDEVYLLIVALNELRYHAKRFALFMVIDTTYAAADMMNLRLTREEISIKLTLLAKEKTPVPVNLKDDPYAYNSFFFSMPEWIIKMWAKQYGDEVAMGILLSTQKRASSWLCVNTSTRSVRDFDDDNRFTVSAICPNALLYNVLGPCSELEEVQDGDLFLQDLSLQYVLDRLDYNFQSRVLHLGAITGGVSANIGLKLQGKNGRVSALFEDEKRYRRGRYLYTRLGLKNVDAYYGELKIMKTYFGDGQFDLVVVTPPSSFLGQIQKRPDIPLTLKKEDLLDIIKIEKEYINEASHFVDEDGMLVYSVQTINQDEGEKIIDKFLAEHENFELLKSHQILPTDFNSDGLYFAIMKRI